MPSFAVISWSSALLFVYLNFCLPLIVFLRQSWQHGHDDPMSPRRRPRKSAGSKSAATFEGEFAGSHGEWLLADADSRPPVPVPFSLKGSVQDPELESVYCSNEVHLLPHAEGEEGEEEETVASTLRVVPHVPCLASDRQPGSLPVATGLLCVVALLAIACFTMQVAQLFIT